MLLYSNTSHNTQQATQQVIERAHVREVHQRTNATKARQQDNII